MRLLAVLDIQGNWQAFADAYSRELRLGRPPDAIVHTGNLGLWLTNLVVELNDISYARQVVAFLSVLPPSVVESVNNLLQISGNSGGNGTNENNDEIEAMALALAGHRLSHYDDYLGGGNKQLPCPVYSVYGPLDHPLLVTQLLNGELNVPNLFIVDHNHVYVLDDEVLGLLVKLYGLGGTVKLHSLFDHGPIAKDETDDGENDDVVAPVCGKVGELWVTMVQIAELYVRAMEATSDGDDNTISSDIDNADNDGVSSTINIFMAHAPVIKTPLLEHLAIITHADFTVSQGLHFRYPVSGNGMSFVDLMGGSAGYLDHYRLKFSRLRMILGELWAIVRHDVCRHLDTSVVPIIELALLLFDKIPVLIADTVDEIVPLLVAPTLATSSTNNTSSEDTLAKPVLKRINDYYFQAYYNLWHFNVCDVVLEDRTHLNVMGFLLDENHNFVLEHCTSQGFNFRFKKEKQNLQTNDTITNSTSASVIRGRGTTRQRGRRPGRR